MAIGCEFISIKQLCNTANVTDFRPNLPLTSQHRWRGGTVGRASE